MGRTKLINGIYVTGANFKAGDIPATDGHLLASDLSGNVIDSNINKTTVAVKDSDAVADNMAKMDANGNAVDSGIAVDTLAQKSYVNTVVLGAMDNAY